MTARVYFPSARISHILPWAAKPRDGEDALCGRSPWPGGWHGTESAAELEKARELPLCVSCRNKAMEPKGKN